MKDVFMAEELEYSYDEYSNAYSVTGLGDYVGEKLYIPPLHNEKEVVKIEDFAFQNCKKIQSAVLSSQTRYIGEAAFNFCENLQEINIPFGVVSIEKYTFYGCKRLERVDINDSVRQIEENAFGDCGSLREIVFPASLLRIGKRAFYNCGNLTEAILPASLKMVEEGAFYCCEKLKRVILNEGLTSIGKFAFGGCSNVSSVVYNGSTAKWREIQKDTRWNGDMPVKKIICKDGEVKL